MPVIRLPPVYLGIDPGVSGGLAAIQNERLLYCVPMPVTERDVWLWFSMFLSTKSHVVAVIEQVTGFVGGEGNTGSSMFTFGQSYGGLRMALTAADIRFESVAPRTWQKGLKIPTRAKDETKTVWKNRLKAKAQQLFPGVNVTLKTADAILIAEFCRRKETGIL